MCQSCTLSARVTDNPNALVHLVHVQETGTPEGALPESCTREKREKREKRERKKGEREKEKL